MIAARVARLVAGAVPLALVIVVPPDNAFADEASCPVAVRDALRLLAKSDAAAAAERLERMRARCEGSKELQFWRGQTYRRLGRTADARAAFEAFSALDPTNPDGPRFVGETLVAERRFAEARHAFEKAVALDPDNPTLRDLAGRTWDIVSDPASEPPRVAPSPPATVTSRSASILSPQATPRVWQRVQTEGFAGILGGRRAWWTRVLAVLAFLLASLLGVGLHAAVSGRVYGPAPRLYLSGLVFAAALYMTFWGTPVGVGWGLLSVHALWFAKGVLTAATQDV